MEKSSIGKLFQNRPHPCTCPTRGKFPSSISEKMGNLPSFSMIRIAQKLSAGSEKFLGIVGNGKIKYWETISEQGPPLYYPYPRVGVQAQFRKK
jgi:hypothetical protein